MKTSSCEYACSNVLLRVRNFGFNAKIWKEKYFLNANFKCSQPLRLILVDYIIKEIKNLPTEFLKTFTQKF